MSIKDAFGKSTNKVLAGTEVQKIYQELESEGFVEEIVEDKERFLPSVDFTTASNFARYGSAEKYYSDAIKNVYLNYPYDGSRKEKQEWRNKSSQLDLYVFDKIYPKSTGYINLSGSQYNEDGKNSYIIVYGGPNNPNSQYTDSIASSFEYSNKFEPAKNRSSNLALNPNGLGNTVEFWYKCNIEDIEAKSNVIFDIWNGDKIRLSARFYQIFGNNPSIEIFEINESETSNIEKRISSFVIEDISLSTWNHYAITFKPLENGYADISLYINSKFIKTSVSEYKYFSSNINYSNLICTIGAYAPTYEHSINGCIDEFRFWKEVRTAQEIGRNWFTIIGGGSNTDDANTELGIYYKFNEGITGDDEYDCKVLDYSGRLSNGTIINYSNTTRSTGSAINEYSNLNSKPWKETPDPILYSFHPHVINAIEQYEQSGSEWDSNNNSSIYKSLPAWIAEEDENKGSGDLQNLVQIISSYFDTLHLQIEAFSSIKDINYKTNNQKQVPFIDKILSSNNFQNLDIFSNVSLIEDILSRNEEIEYEQSITEIKNSIFQNIYNNLIYIYKSKGTEKSFRNLIRCFGVDDELIKINLYADNTSYNLENSYNGSSYEKIFLDFNHVDRYGAFVCSYPDNSGDISGYGSIPSISGEVNNYIPITLQTEVIFPKKLEDNKFQEINFNSISLFGVHKANSENTLEWGDDEFNFQITAEKFNYDSKDAYFKLVGCFKDDSLNEYNFELTSSWFKNIYENEKWNFAVRIKQQNYDNQNIVSNTLDNDYVLEFIGINSHFDSVENMFKLSKVIPKEYMKNALGVNKRIFLGAHCENFDSSYILAKTNVKISSVRFWFDSISDEELIEHSKDVSSYGRKNPNWNFAPYNEQLSGLEVTKIETLALNWDFSLVKSSDNDGSFIVDDRSNQKNLVGSSLKPKLLRRYTAKAFNFPANSDQVVNKEYLYSNKLQIPESITTSELIQIKDTDDVSKNKNTKPVNYYYSIEKSMSQVINDEILKWFATIDGFNNLLGEPINRYRKQYRDLISLRRVFFEQVGNSPDFERFLEFFKWIDSSISMMIEQLVPASANISSTVRNVVESHLLERNKIENKLPIIEKNKKNIINSFTTIVGYDYSEQKAGNNPGSKWLKERARRNEPIVSSGNEEIDTKREQIRRVISSKNIFEVPRGYDKIEDEVFDIYHDKIRNFTNVLNYKVQKLNILESILSPVNIENIKYSSDYLPPESRLTGSGQILPYKNKRIGNYRSTYEYFQTSGRKDHNIGLSDIIDSLNQYSESPFIEGLYERKLPERPVIKSIFVERFAAPGGSEVSSRGSLDAESEEYSIYNNLNYRNSTVRDTLNQWTRETSSINSEAPSFHKVNKNTNYVFTDIDVVKKQYDNAFITHQIPRSDLQYNWMTASVLSRPKFSGYFNNYDNLSSYNNGNLELLSSSRNTDFLGLNLNSNVIKTFDTASGLTDVSTASLDLNSYLVNINGPYQGAGWKQLYKFNNKIVNNSRKNNKILSQDLPEIINSYDKNGNPITVNQKKSTTFKEFIEPPVEFNSPMKHKIKMPESIEDISLISSYDNNLSTITNLDLRKNLKITDKNTPQTHDKLLDLEKSDLLQKPKIMEITNNSIIFPRKSMIGLKNIRSKNNYDDNGFTGSVINERTFWRDDVANRSRPSEAKDLFGFTNNGFSGVPATSMSMFNTTPAINIYGVNQAKESIFALDNSFDKSISSYDITYQNYVKGNLSKNSLSEEKAYILNNINYYMDNIVMHDMRNNGNFYNIKGDFDFYQLFETPPTLGAVNTSINSIVSSSEGIYIGGFFLAKNGDTTVTLFNGEELININFPIHDWCSSLISGSDGLYVGGNFGCYKYDGTSWTDIFSSHPYPSDNVFSMLSCSYGLIVGSNNTRNNCTNFIYIYNGLTWQQLGNTVISSTDIYLPLSMVSGSDGIYMGFNIIGGSIFKYTGSLSTPDAFSPYVRYLTFTNWCYSFYSSSTEFYAGGASGLVKKFDGTNWNSVGTALNSFGGYEVTSILSNSSGLYVAGEFLDDTLGNRLNGFARWDGTKWNYIGRSAKRGGLNFTKNDRVNCMIQAGDKIYLGGTFKSVRSAPIIKDNRNIYTNAIEAYSYNQNSLSPYNMLIPHPQLVFNNFIPPLSGNLKIDEVIYSDNEIPTIKTYESSNAVFIVNEGFVYETEKISGKKPFFDSYEQYISDIKPHSQKFSSIPEYTISDYMKKFVNTGDFKLALSDNYLKSEGSQRESDFNTVNDEINTTNQLLISDKINKMNNFNLEMNIKVSGLKKFLPKKDFYPSERVVTLSNYFINSFLDPNISLTSSYNFKDKFNSTLSNGTPINGQILTLLQPLFSPGILLNTIKSSLAVDWPIYIADSGSYDSKNILNFYSSSKSELITQKIQDPNGNTALTSSYLATNYLEKDPTLRLPFESLINFDSVIPANLKDGKYNLYYLNPSHYTSDILTGSDYDEISFPSYNMDTGSLKKFQFKDSNYQLAMHNFLAEIPNLFLQNGLTKFVSSNKKAHATKDVTYIMDVVVEKSPGYKSFITDPYYENKKSDITNFYNGTFMIPSVDSLYGPPMRYWENTNYAATLFTKSPYNFYFKTIDTPAYAPYVPPYAYGKSIARIKFTPDDTREWTIKEIVNASTIEYFNPQANDLFKQKSGVLSNGPSGETDNYSTSPAYRNMMKISSSVNLKTVTNILNPLFNASTGEATEINSSDDHSWVIQTKFETPSINFANASLKDNVGLKFSGVNRDGDSVSGVFTNMFKGLWTTYGEPATLDSGITMRIENAQPAYFSAFEGESLAELCGFEIGKSKQIGAISNEKTISEGVVITPFTTEYRTGEQYESQYASLIKPIKGEYPEGSQEIPYYFKIDRAILNKVVGLSFDKNSKVTFEQIKKRVESPEVDANNSIIKLIKSMTKFVIPPHLDWLRNKNIDPFVMYIFEFDVKLDREDLSDIWQGVMPKPSLKVEKDEVFINHEMSKEQLFHGMKLPTSTRFKMFKVKQKANINYYQLTDDSKDDSAFKFKFGNTEQRPEYSYNWPYDFCSIVEYVSVEAGITMKRKDDSSQVSTTNIGNISTTTTQNSVNIQVTPTNYNQVGVKQTDALLPFNLKNKR